MKVFDSKTCRVRASNDFLDFDGAVLRELFVPAMLEQQCDESSWLLAVLRCLVQTLSFCKMPSEGLVM